MHTFNGVSDNLPGRVSVKFKRFAEPGKVNKDTEGKQKKYTTKVQKRDADGAPMEDANGNPIYTIKHKLSTAALSQIVQKNTTMEPARAVDGSEAVIATLQKLMLDRAVKLKFESWLIWAWKDMKKPRTMPVIQFRNELVNGKHVWRYKLNYGKVKQADIQNIVTLGVYQHPQWFASGEIRINRKRPELRWSRHVRAIVHAQSKQIEARFEELLPPPETPKWKRVPPEYYNNPGALTQEQREFWEKELMRRVEWRL
jgi:hypothetical protein